MKGERTSKLVKRYKLMLYQFIYNFIQLFALKIHNLNYKIVMFNINRNSLIKLIINDIPMYICLNDQGLSKDLYLYKKREVFATEYLNEFIRKDEIIIDIGSNLGYFALLMSNLAKNGKIYAIEPVPLNMNILKRNIDLNKLKNISTFQIAIADKEGESKFYFLENFNNSSLEKLDEKLNLKLLETIKVKTTTLDNFIKNFVLKEHLPTFIRMDLEGYEYSIFKNSPEMLNFTNMKLFIELHPTLMSENKIKEMINIIKNNNFKINSIILEPSIKQIKYIKILNVLRKNLEFYPFGFVDNSYSGLYKLIEEKNGKLMVFFEK